jgi:hypothetical protein
MNTASVIILHLRQIHMVGDSGSTPGHPFQISSLADPGEAKGLPSCSLVIAAMLQIFVVSAVDRAGYRL